MDHIIVGRSYVRATLPRRREDGHKGTFGKLLLVGGAVGYTGAPYLAALGAVHSGCGLVFLGVPQSIWAIEAAKCTSAMPFPLPDDGAMLTPDALAPLHERLQNADVLAIGPGLGRSAGTRALVCALLREAEVPVVLDADALNVLSEDLSPLDERAGALRTTVLTPHLGEFARLLGRPSEGPEGVGRGTLAQRFAAEHGCVLLLKGHPSLIALPDGRVLENSSGGSALAKGGSGDVLTGLIASLLCQGTPAAEAAACGAWLHGRAGDLLAQELTAYCVTPAELASRGLAMAFSDLLQ